MSLETKIMVWAGAALVLGIVLFIADLISENRKYRKNPEYYIATDRSEEGAGKITGPWLVCCFVLALVLMLIPEKIS